MNNKRDKINIYHLININNNSMEITNGNQIKKNFKSKYECQVEKIKNLFINSYNQVISFYKFSYFFIFHYFVILLRIYLICYI